jgi:hypothetical protein
MRGRERQERRGRLDGKPFLPFPAVLAFLPFPPFPLYFAVMMK